MRAANFFLLLAATCLACQAQDGFSATYDDAHQIKLQGIVTKVDWANPHAYIFMNVRDSIGTTYWAIQIGNPIDLEHDGWKSSTVHIGDSVTVEGNPAQGDHRQVFATSVTLARTGVKVFTVAKHSAPVASKVPAPRWPDGKPRLGVEPGKKGHWSVAANVALVDSKAGNIPMNAEGLLKNFADAGKVAPFLPWAKAVYEYRQRTLLKDDPLLRCLPPGGPRQFQMPHGFQFVEQKEIGRIMVLMGGGDRNWHAIYVDGRQQGQPDEVVRSYYGNSVGKWDGDTLVVDTIGFNEHFWMSNGGLPHTEALHLTEKFSRPNYDTLRYEVTVDDPRTYSRPWTGGWNAQWIPNEEIQEYFCEENVESTLTR